MRAAILLGPLAVERLSAKPSVASCMGSSITSRAAGGVGTGAWLALKLAKQLDVLLLILLQRNIGG